jgi:hypothetical protein
MPSGVIQELESTIEQADAIRGFSPALGWSHYQTLLQVEHKAARLIKSRNKAGMLDQASKGQALQGPIDTIKDPYVLYEQFA